MKIAIIKSLVDAHTLGISSFSSILDECGVKVTIADDSISRAVEFLNDPKAQTDLKIWLLNIKPKSIGFSHRLDPLIGAELFKRLADFIKRDEELSGLRLVFAGLPPACKKIQEECPYPVMMFSGDETPYEALIKFGVAENNIPKWLVDDNSYDNERISFGKSIIDKADYLGYSRPFSSVYEEKGTLLDGIEKRLASKPHGEVLLRTHVGPYSEDRKDALKLFNVWLKQLSQDKMLDIVSVGASQLTQERFGKNWNNLPNGGGVPISSEKEFSDLRNYSGDMLLRSYSGTNNVKSYAAMLDRTINNAWHALSLFWFNKSDKRGPMGVKEGLKQHVDTMQYLASTGGVFEPNISHHFSFRGADDLSSIVATYLAVKLAKMVGIKTVILQMMLNTPKLTSGIVDLSKFRALLSLVNELASDEFTVHLQPRAGLSYFSPNLDKAKMQLSAVTCMMDDIKPEEFNSPSIIHVVNYSEAVALADPGVITESAKITRYSLEHYRKTKLREGQFLTSNQEEKISMSSQELVYQAKKMLKHMESKIPNLYSSNGLYIAYRDGYLAVPDLWDCRDELFNATNWKSKIIAGSMSLVNNSGKKYSIDERLTIIEQNQAQGGVVF